jgi:hypothetical protein
MRASHTFRRIRNQVVAFGGDIFTQSTVQVHSNMVKPQSHKISTVPRLLGADVHPTGFQVSAVLLLIPP